MFGKVKELKIQLQRSEIEKDYLKQDIEELRAKNKYLKKEVESLNTKLRVEMIVTADPKILVQEIMKGKMTWFDYKKLSRDERVTYYDGAQQILKNDVFKNVINYLINEWATWTLRHAGSYGAIRDMRMQVSAFDLLRKELESIEEPDKAKPPTDPQEIL